MDLGLTGKVALITGGSYGIGRASAISMGREGAHVAICARRGEVLEEAAMEVREKTGAQVLPIQADVTKAEDIERTVQIDGGPFWPAGHSGEQCGLFCGHAV